MKGISEIIATILMLMITLGLSGTAYLFISGALTQQTQGLELLDAFCVQGATDNSTIFLRNLGTSAVNTSKVTILQTSPETTIELRWGSASIEPGSSSIVYDECEGSGPRICSYRIIPPGGRSLNAPISCS